MTQPRVAPLGAAIANLKQLVRAPHKFSPITKKDEPDVRLFDDEYVGSPLT